MDSNKSESTTVSSQPPKSLFKVWCCLMWKEKRGHRQQLGGEGEPVVSVDEVYPYEPWPMRFVPAYPQKDSWEVPLPPSQTWMGGSWGLSQSHVAQVP